MKYLKEAAFKTKSVYIIAVSVVISIVCTTINTEILIWISNAVTNYKDPMHWVNLVIIGCVSIIVLAIVRPWFNNIGNHKVYTYLYNRLTDKLVCADYDLYTKFSPGEIITTAESLWNITRLVILSLNMIRNLITFIITMIAIGLIAPKVIVPIGIVYIIAAIVLYIATKKWNEADEELDSNKRKRNRELDEIINGFAEVRSFSHAVEHHQKSITSMNNSVLSMIGKRIRVDSFITVWYQVIDGAVTVGILAYVILALNNGSMTSSATAVTLAMYAWRLIEPMASFVDSLSEVSSCKAPLPKFERVMNYENTVPTGSIDLESFDREIQFNHVDFSYDKSSYVLNDVSFSVKKGEHIGICGPTGGGKSTLLKLVPKFYDVTGGSITIDGINLKDLTTTSVREHIGIVHQSPYIFDGSIMSNIKYAGFNRTSSGNSVTDAEVIDACKKASIYDFVMSLPDKFETQVGPRGLKLSGGQKQRIALARLFISNPDIIILDEATSALDNETERFVQDSLNAFRDKTMIVVAHRLSTIKNSDKIIVIDEHRVVEQGTHEELIEKKGLYESMYNN